MLGTKWGEEFAVACLFLISRPHARRSVERSLTRLQTDWLDIVFVHSDGNDLALIENGVFDVLQDLKSAGMIRANGMSVKTVAGGMRAVDLSECGDGDLQSAGTSGLPVIAHAHQQGKGVLIKKALASGHKDRLGAGDPVETAMRFFFQVQGVPC